MPTKNIFFKGKIRMLGKKSHAVRFEWEFPGVMWPLFTFQSQGLAHGNNMHDFESKTHWADLNLVLLNIPGWERDIHSENLAKDIKGNKGGGIMQIVIVWISLLLSLFTYFLLGGGAQSAHLAEGKQISIVQGLMPGFPIPFPSGFAWGIVKQFIDLSLELNGF